MDLAYRLAAAAVKQRLAEQYPKNLEVLKSIRVGDVVAYAGSYDQVEKVLELLGIPVTINPNSKFLAAAQIVFVNCSNEYNNDFVNQITAHVEQGKWLVTSDWALHYVVEKAFPNTVRWNQGRTDEEVVSVEPYLNSLWSNVVVLGADPQWWLWGSFPIEVIDAEKVTIEAASHDLLVKYKAPVVAVRFDWGKGNVFHVISHFWAKKTGTPTLRHQGSSVDFLKAGMRLTEEGINKVLAETKINAESVNFAQLQSAVTSTELVAQLSVKAVSQLTVC